MENRFHARRNSRIRYAVVGLGRISQTAVLPAFARAGENSQLAALVSSDPNKLLKYSSKYQVKNSYSYDQYADCLRSGEVDAVYIALPNSLQRTYTELAAKAGIHILCEKPMTPNEADCEAMIAATEEAGVKFMTGYRLQFELVNLHAVNMIKSGEIGEPRIFTSIFSKKFTSGYSRHKKNIGGSALYEMEVSCINTAHFLFGAGPQEVFAWNMSWTNRRGKPAPEITSGLLKYPDHRIATFATSFGAADRSILEVIGTKGRLRMDPAYESGEDLKSEIAIDDWRMKEVINWRDQFVSELVYFSDCILNNKDPQPSGQNGLAGVRVARALLQSAKMNRPVSLPPVEVSSWPYSGHDSYKGPGIDSTKLARAVSLAS